MMAYVSGNCFLWTDHVGIRRGIVGAARKCVQGFLDCDPAINFGDPPRSVADRVCRKDDCLCGRENGLFQCVAKGGRN